MNDVYLYLEQVIVFLYSGPAMVRVLSCALSNMYPNMATASDPNNTKCP